MSCTASILLTPLLSTVVASLLYAVCLYRAYGALDTLSPYIYYELLILATTLDCPRDVVKVYDSVFSFLDQETRKVLKNLFTVSDFILQRGCTDCGVFSIANAITIAFGLDPAKQVL